MKRRAGLACLLAPALAACAWPAPGRGRRVGLGESLAKAVAAAGDGDTVELEAGDHVGQTAIVGQRRLTLRAVGGRARLLADGAHAEGKALLVVRGGEVLIEDLEFRGARVPDGNGAGIRFEQGRLTLRRCAFFDNEMGLLSSNRSDAELVIDDCDFGQAPRHEGLLHHLLYVGRMRSLTLRGCRFAGGWRGHLVKSRAARNLILCNQLVDGDDGEASYQLDLPNGGLARVLGNVLAQGPRPQNTTLLSFGAEGAAHADSALFVAHNSFVNMAEAPAGFVRHWPDRLPADSVVELHHNLLVGAALAGTWGTPEQGNLPYELSALDRGAWPRVALRAGAAPLPLLPAAPERRGAPLAPTHEITFPLGMRPLASRRLWLPGAFQD